MLSLHELETLVAERRRTLLAEAARSRLAGPAREVPVRAALATALIALAARLAPPVQSGQQPSVIGYRSRA